MIMMMINIFCRPLAFVARDTQTNKFWNRRIFFLTEAQVDSTVRQRVLILYRPFLSKSTFKQHERIYNNQTV